MEKKDRKLSQCDQILGYLKEGHSITPIDALNLFGCFRLAARIADLKKRGNEIITTKSDGHAIYTLMQI